MLPTATDRTIVISLLNTLGKYSCHIMLLHADRDTTIQETQEGRTSCHHKKLGRTIIVNRQNIRRGLTTLCDEEGSQTRS